MSTKVDGATGVISIAIFGVQAVLTPADALVWGNTFIQMAPALLILFLIWRIHKLDKLYTECRRDLARTVEQLAHAHVALATEIVEEHSDAQAQLRGEQL